MSEKVMQDERDEQSPEERSGERLQKVLAQAGLGSRRAMEEWIAAGRVTVNGNVAALGVRVLGDDVVRVDDRIVHMEPSNS
ncbi:MAG: S4 domain-containing protein, partial [Pseudomonadota bacterium]